LFDFNWEDFDTASIDGLLKEIVDGELESGKSWFEMTEMTEFLELQTSLTATAASETSKDLRPKQSQVHRHMKRVFQLNIASLKHFQQLILMSFHPRATRR